jgi:hypothetical protein
MMDLATSYKNLVIKSLEVDSMYQAFFLTFNVLTVCIKHVLCEIAQEQTSFIKGCFILDNMIVEWK